MASDPNNVVNSSSSDSDSTVIIVVFVSFGCIFLLALALFVLCCFIKCRKKKTSEEADNVRVDEHMKVKEDVVEGPHGGKAVVLTIEDDVHIEEEMRKNEKFGGGMHAKSSGQYQLEQKP